MKKLYLLVEFYPITAVDCGKPVVVGSHGVASKSIKKLKKIANVAAGLKLKWEKVGDAYVSHEIEPNWWFEVQEMEII